MRSLKHYEIIYYRTWMLADSTMEACTPDVNEVVDAVKRQKRNADCIAETASEDTLSEKRRKLNEEEDRKQIDVSSLSLLWLVVGRFYCFQ